MGTLDYSASYFTSMSHKECYMVN